MASNLDEETLPLICSENSFKKIRFVHQISYDNYSIREETTYSDQFFPPSTDQPKFYLRFVPKAPTVLELYLAETNVKFNFKTDIKICIVDKRGESRKNEAKSTIFRGKNDCLTLFSMNRADLLNEENGYLLDDKLTIRIEFCCYLDYTFQEIIEPAQWKADRFVKSIEQNILADFGALLKNGKYSDAILVAGEKQFAVHKSILTTRSSVFSAMFQHETKEKLLNRVDIIDVDANVLEKLLHFIYSGDVSSIEGLEDKLLVAADKYGLDQLKDVCEDALCAKLTPETAPGLLVLADMHNATNLKAKALRYFEKNTQESIRNLFANNNAELLVEAFRNIAKMQSTAQLGNLST